MSNIFTFIKKISWEKKDLLSSGTPNKYKTDPKKQVEILLEILIGTWLKRFVDGSKILSLLRSHTKTFIQ